MIFFSKDLAEGRISDEIVDLIIEAYKRYIEYLIAKYPEVKKYMEKSYNDYIFLGTIIDENGQYIGYKSPNGDVEKIYIFSTAENKRRNRYVGLEVWYQEFIFDEVDEKFKINILFTNRDELCIKLEKII